MPLLAFRWAAATSMLLTCVTGCSDTGPTSPESGNLPSGAAVGQLAGSAAGVDWTSTMARGQLLRAGETRSVLSLPAGERPEGIVLVPGGIIYVGDRHRDPDTGAFVRNEILRVDRRGWVSRVADLGPAPAGAPGLLGLATNRLGEVYGAFASFDPATSGVYRVGPDGSGVERLPGSEAIIFPNGLTFDAFGDLYVTDSLAGVVWRYRRDGAFVAWIRDPSLAPVAIPGFPPLPGANGIVYQPSRGLFVANTSRGTIVRIPVDDAGGAGTPEIVASGLVGIDGLAAYPQGPLYFVNAGANLLGIPPVGRVHPETGEVTPVTSDLEAFDDPTSVVLGWGAYAPGTAFVVNADIFPPTGAGPGIVQIGLR